MKLNKPLLIAIAATLLSACGSDNNTSNNSAPPTTTSRIRVVGDSLNDSGVFGLKFTIASATGATKIWVDHVAAGLSLANPCPRYAATSQTNVVLNPSATACSSFAVGGARINPVGTAADLSPFGIMQQLRDAANFGAYAADEVLLVDGGGNDAATLFENFLNPDKTAYVGLLGEGLPAAQVATAVAGGANGLVAAGADYMKALANLLVDTLQSQAIDKGAKKIVIMNMPDITKTPRFQAALALVSAANGGGAAGAAAAAQAAGIAQSWASAFNSQVSFHLKDHRNVLVVDFFSTFNTWLSKPADYGLTNVTTPACANGFGATCVDAVLSATPPAGANANWWQSYAFSDSFHGTPKTNEMMGALVLDAMKAKGWR